MYISRHDYNRSKEQSIIKQRNLFMPIIDHYKIFIESNHKNIITVIHNNTKLEIYLYEVIHEKNIAITNKFHKLDYKSYDILKKNGLNLEKEIAKFICKNNSQSSIDLFILHEEFHTQFESPTIFNHLSILKAWRKMIPDTCSVLCNANNLRNCPKDSILRSKIAYLLKNNLFSHLFFIKKSGYKIISRHSILCENGLPDNIISFDRALQQLHYNKMQSQRNIIGRTLTQLLIFLKLAHFFEPGYFFKLNKC